MTGLGAAWVTVKGLRVVVLTSVSFEAAMLDLLLEKGALEKSEM